MKSKFLTVFLVALFLVSACGKQSAVKSQHYVLKPESFHKSLFFSGTIQPLSENPLTSPADAVVQTMHYHYGQQVKKGDLIISLSSNELQKQYNETLTEYLKAKDSFSVTKARFNGTQDLWNAGLISKNNFMSEKSSLATARVSLIQATKKLSELLEKMDEKNSEDLSALSLVEFDKVRKALAGQHNLIRIKAPADGVLLYPPKSTEDKTGKLSVGSSVKSGQVLALVGDLTGLSVEIEIPEIDIDKVHPGMKAKVSGVALGNEVLPAELVSVNAQAVTGTSGALPSFNAIVEVKKLTPEQQALIKVGLSASIELAIEAKEQLLLPIRALKQENGKALVQLVTKMGSVKKQWITTGEALADKVVVASGLKAGDVVAYE